MASALSILKKLRDDARALWDESIFRSDVELSRLHKFIHFWVLVYRSFVRNRCPIRASALSYTTLLAFIPMLAVAFSVTSVFLKSEGKEQIESFIQQFVDRMIPPAVLETNAPGAAAPPGEPAAPAADASGGEPSPEAGTVPGPVSTPAAQLVPAPPAPPAPTNAATPPPPATSDTRVVTAQRQAAQYIHAFIQKTRSGTIGVAGTLFLLITAIMTLTRIEEAFNDIWGVTRGRDWFARIVNYFAAIVGGPILLFGALGLAGGAHFQKTREFITGMPVVEPLVSNVLPIVVICLTFTLFYKLVPNTKVHFGAALMGGVLAGTLWHVYNLLGFLLASRAVSASRFYGSLALVPLFMGGLYIVWLTVLFGAQVAYAFQNRSLYLQEKIAENVNQRGREFIALRLLTCIGQRFQRGLSPATIQQMSGELAIPSRLVQQVLQTLIAAHLVAEVSGADAGYAPARPLESINAHHVLMAMRATQGQELVTRDEPVRREVYGEFARIQEAEKIVASTVTIRALVERAQARLEPGTPLTPAEELKLKPALLPVVPPPAQKPAAGKNESPLP